MITFPRETGPAIVDWVDYADTVNAGSPGNYANRLINQAGTRHHVWLAWMSQYQTYGIKCETIATALLNASTREGGGGRNQVIASMKKFYEPMNLTEFTTSGR